MCGSALVITSPSISSTRRSTPCAAGCCGPKFSVKFWISGIARILEIGFVAGIAANPPRRQRARLDRRGPVRDTPFLRVVAHFAVADQRKILAERMADEAIVRDQS